MLKLCLWYFNNFDQTSLLYELNSTLPELHGKIFTEKIRLICHEPKLWYGVNCFQLNEFKIDRIVSLHESAILW